MAPTSTSRRKLKPGCIIPGTSIACDYWSRNSAARVFFLSHAHSDHTQGLTPSFDRPIYSSPITARILRLWYKDLDESLIHELEVDESHIVSYECPGGGRERKQVSVTVLDANHCSGAVMFLFEGEIGRVLYTGDFRYESHSAIFQSPSYQRLFSQHFVLDLMFLDNTYWGLGATKEFPSREIATKQVIEIIRDHPKYYFIIGLTRLGKEELLYKIGEELDELIYVSDLNRYALLERINGLNVFTKKREESRIEVVMRYDMMRELKRRSKEALIGILPSALPLLIPDSFQWLTEESGWKEKTRWVIYSDHSSHSELVAFLEKIGRVGRIQPMALHMTSEEKRRFLIPEHEMPRPQQPSTSKGNLPSDLFNGQERHFEAGTDSDSPHSGSGDNPRKGRKRERKEVSGRPRPRRSHEDPISYMSSPEPSPMKKRTVLALHSQG